MIRFRLTGLWGVFFLSMQAEIPFTQIKGLYTPLHEHKKHLSPVHGFNWWKLNIIQSMYRYGDSDHATIKLLKELFFLQHDGITFDTTTLKHYPAAYFTPVTIGAILNALEEYSDNQEELRKELILIINGIAKEMEPYGSQIKDQLKIIESTFAKLSKELKDQHVIYKKQGKDDETLSNQIQKLTQLKNMAKKERESKRNIINQLEKKPHILVDLIIESAKESNDILYAKNTLQTILLAFGYKKANSKEDFSNYFKQFKSGIITVKDYQQWLNDNYTQEDFNAIKNSILNKDFSFLDDYERASFFGYAQKVWDSPLPPIVSSIGDATYAPDGVEYQFPDCGETSLRNFFNIALYDSGNRLLDVSLLPKQADRKLVEYYTNYKSVDAVGTKKYYDAWTHIVSNIPGVTYSKKTANNQGFDITPGLDNLMRVIGHLLFKDNDEFAQSAIDKKLDFLCKIVSRQDFKLEWDVVGGKKEDVLNKENNTTISISLTITKSGQERLLIWEFFPNHFVLTLSEPKKSSGLLPISDLVIEKITSNASYWINILGWFSSASNVGTHIDTLIKNKSSNGLLYIYCMQHFSDNEQKLRTLSSILNKKLPILNDKSIVLIIASLPIDRYYFDSIITDLGVYRPGKKTFGRSTKPTYKDDIMMQVLAQLSINNQIALLPILFAKDVRISTTVIIDSINNLQRPLSRQTIERLYAAIQEMFLAFYSYSHKQVSEIIVGIKERLGLDNSLQETTKIFQTMGVHKKHLIPMVLPLELFLNKSIAQDSNWSHVLLSNFGIEISNYFKNVGTWKHVPQEDKELILNLFAQTINNKPDLIDTKDWLEFWQWIDESYVAIDQDNVGFHQAIQRLIKAYGKKTEKRDANEN